MAAHSHTTYSLKHFHYIFTVLDVTVKKMEAHVIALSREESDMLFKRACPNVWTMLDTRELGTAKQWIIRGKKTRVERPHVYQVGEYFDDTDTATPFTDFVNLYVDTFKSFPLPNLRHQLFKHNGTHVPTAEQLAIIADETGERAEYIQALIDQEFRARWFENTVTRFGAVHVLTVVSKNEYEALMIGRGTEAAWARLQNSMPNFGLTRYYPMTAGELLFFHDMNGGLSSSLEIYSGKVSILDFPKRTLKYLCTIDSRFADLAAKEKQSI
jgi:hypothetical protein